MYFGNDYKFFVPIKFINGIGSFSRLGSLAKPLGSRAMIVTGKNAMKKLGYTKAAADMLAIEKFKVTIYDNISPNPTTDMVDEGASIAQREKCDAIIGLGGGSAIDAAKAIAVVAGNGGKIWDYQSGEKNTSKTLPIVAVPTTAGSGTEGDRYFVITNKALSFKEGFASDFAYPKISILDAKLTESLPERITMETAIDALGHSVEAFYSKMNNALSDMISLNSIWLIMNFLPRAIKDGSDMEARSALMLAATMGGIAINHNGVAAPHGFAMCFGGQYGITHAHGVGVMLPYSVEKAAMKEPSKFSFMSSFMGWSNTTDESKNASVAVEKIHQFMDAIGYPRKLTDIGIKKDDLDTIIEKVYGDEDLANDPGSYETRDDIKEFIKKAL